MRNSDNTRKRGQHNGKTGFEPRRDDDQAADRCLPLFNGRSFLSSENLSHGAAQAMANSFVCDCSSLWDKVEIES